ncbi:MAG: peptidoglycan DD-metalloendopeptidase family protein [Chloroflexi bacterium]|nr:peptidoglycan DD-metalloendopeptidase family protein [Chloroflexota bacterium]
MAKQANHPSFVRRSRQCLNHWLWALVLILIILSGTYFAWTAAWNQPNRSLHPVPTIATPDLSAELPPSSYYAAVLPDVEQALMKDNLLDNSAGLSVIAAGIPPVGVYLSRTGNSQFSLTTPTPLSALPPIFPTTAPSTATLIPSEDQGIITATPPDFFDPSGQAGPTIVANGEVPAEGCAPAGLPVDGILTQRFHQYHSGIDLGIPLGTPVQATHSGTVTFAGWSEIGYGYLVILQSGTFITYYAHLTSFNVSSGQSVGRFSVIGWSGSTGNSTGPHVHYETRINDAPVDPLSFEQRGYGTC